MIRDARNDVENDKEKENTVTWTGNNNKTLLTIHWGEDWSQKKAGNFSQQMVTDWSSRNSRPAQPKRLSISPSSTFSPGSLPTNRRRNLFDRKFTTLEEASVDWSFPPAPWTLRPLGERKSFILHEAVGTYPCSSKKDSKKTFAIISFGERVRGRTHAAR